MSSLLQWLKTITAILGPIVAIIGLVQSRGWLAVIGGLLACVAGAATFYARTQRLRLDNASVEIEGISIDSLNAANLRRRVNDRFFIQAVHDSATIDGADLEVVWRYAGYCRKNEASSFEFSVDSSSSIPFSQLGIFGYDLRSDPERVHPIQPLLVGPDSLSKKVAIPFARPVAEQQPFEIELNCRLPETFNAPLGYYTSTLSFAQATIARSTVKIVFRAGEPEWLRVYECIGGGGPRLLRSLTGSRQADGSMEYVDAAENRNARSARVYLFKRKNPR